MSVENLEIYLSGQVYALHNVVRILALNQMRALNGVPLLDVRDMLELLKRRGLNGESDAKIWRNSDFRQGVEIGLSLFDGLTDEVVLARIINNEDISNEGTSDSDQTPNS